MAAVVAMLGKPTTAATIGGTAAETRVGTMILHLRTAAAASIGMVAALREAAALGKAAAVAAVAVTRGTTLGVHGKKAGINKGNRNQHGTGQGKGEGKVSRSSVIISLQSVSN